MQTETPGTPGRTAIVVVESCWLCIVPWVRMLPSSVDDANVALGSSFILHSVVTMPSTLVAELLPKCLAIGTHCRLRVDGANGAFESSLALYTIATVPSALVAELVLRCLAIGAHVAVFKSFGRAITIVLFLLFAVSLPPAALSGAACGTLVFYLSRGSGVRQIEGLKVCRSVGRSASRSGRQAEGLEVCLPRGLVVCQIEGLEVCLPRGWKVHRIKSPSRVLEGLLD